MLYVRKESLLYGGAAPTEDTLKPRDHPRQLLLVGMKSIVNELAGGDRRSIGRSNKVVADVLKNPSLFSEVFHGILSDDPLIRMRSADAAEKITAKHPEYLQDYKRTLIYKMVKVDQ